MDTPWRFDGACHILWVCFTLLVHCLEASHTPDPHQYERALDKVHGPLCYNCHGVDRADACSDIKICSVGEVCMLHGMTSSSGTQSYEASCQSSMMCTMIGQMQMLPVGKRSGVPCHVCCTDDFCNNNCNQGNTPLATVPSGTVDSRLLCYSCNLMEDPASCRHHVTCALGQMCITRETGVSVFGAKQYQSSCSNKEVCQALEIVKADPGHNYCFTCCNNDLCNNHCDYHAPVTSATTTVTSPTTTTTQPTTTTTFPVPTKPPTTHPTTTQKSGPRCWSCATMKSPTDCYHQVTCAGDEVCTLNEVVDPRTSNKHYQTSCQQKDLCSKYHNLLLTHFGAGNFCKECCDTDLCNDFCAESMLTLIPSTMPTTQAPTTTSANHLLRCYDCPSISDPTRCKNTAMCGADQVCMLHELVQNGQHTNMYTSSCRKKQLCEYIGNLMASDAARSGKDYCHVCCTGDLCNNVCPHHVGFTSSAPPTHHPATTMSLTTRKPGDLLVCYGCSVLDDPASCHHIVPCLPGEVCTVHQISGHMGKVQYTASCESKQLCMMYRDLANNGLSTCHSCCEDQLCNTHCDIQSTTPKPTTTPAPTKPTTHHAAHTSPASQGPLECYSCSMISDPSGCPNTKTCGQNEVCMLHEVDSSMTGSKYYEASCESKTVCESIVRLVNAGGISQGHVFCTYCCNTSRCNNHCELTTQPTTSHPLVINGNWATWAGWSKCSVTCGSGTESRTRTCDNPAPQNHGHDCTGSNHQTRACSHVACPVNGHWSTWSLWTACSHTCGSSSQKMRARLCDSPAPAHNGADCQGDNTMTQDCAVTHCPVDGVWSSWTGWSSCSTTCGQGTSQRIRACTSPPPQYGGHDCTGTSVQHQHCDPAPCPVDGHWSTWGTWSSCSHTCGATAQRTRTRTCDNPAPQHHGHDCSGSSTSHKTCSLSDCPIDGHWSHWSHWSSCSATCGAGGQMTRTRTCDHPAPQHHGHDCSGSSTSHKTCSLPDCPSAGPLECFNCDLMYEPNGCPNTQMCDPGQVCMLHEKSSSMSGTKYYEASCERETVCNSVVKVVHMNSAGQGHIFCTYCCNTTKCNNHCELPVSRSITTSILVPTKPMSPGEKCKAASYEYVESVNLCFKLYQDVDTYANAISTCQASGGNLAIIGGDVEWKLVSFQLTVATRVSGKSLYMGGYDVYHNGSYIWPDGSAMTYANWGQGEPALSQQTHRLPCVVVDMADMSWHTDDCRAQRPFICTIQLQ